MPDNAETADPVTEPPSNRLPASREDRELDEYLYAGGHYRDVPIKRIPGGSVPAYLTKSFFTTRTKTGSTSLLIAAEVRAEKRCELQYPKLVTRDIVLLYESAERAFEEWWSHLEDDYPEVDEEDIRQSYLRAYINGYWQKLSDLDHEHPEHYQHYQEEVAKHLKKAIDKQAIDGWRKYSRRFDPRWKQNVASVGRTAGVQGVEDDREIGIGFRNGHALRAFAEECFIKWWQEISCDQELIFQVNRFDYVGLLTIYTQNFRNAYTEAASGEPASGTISARILNAQYFEDVRLYTLELNDPKYQDGPIQFEVQLGGGGETELREVNL